MNIRSGLLNIRLFTLPGIFFARSIQFLCEQEIILADPPDVVSDEVDSDFVVHVEPFRMVISFTISKEERIMKEIASSKFWKLETLCAASLFPASSRRALSSAPLLPNRIICDSPRLPWNKDCSRCF